MDDATLAQLGALLGGAGCVLALWVRGRLPLAGGLAAVVAAEALLGWSLVPRDDLRLLVASPPRVALLVVLALAALAAGLVLARLPAVVPVLVLLAAPFRISVELGAQEAFLLVPLYGVVVAAVIGLVVRAFRGEEIAELPRALAWPMAALVAYFPLTLLWSSDLRPGTIELLFFLFPFVALVLAVARSPIAPWLPRALAATMVSLALVFAAVGIWQLWSENLFFARDLEVANAYTSYFRTTSVFADSSLYGIQLVLGIVVLVVALWAGGLTLWLGVPLIAALWTGLYFTYSQSSMVALAVAALFVSLVAAGRRARWALAVGTVVFLLAGAGVVAAVVQGDSAQRFTSGRSGLVEDTANVFFDHPLVGVGLGAQPKESREDGGKRETARNESHTTPLTVAAEGGVVGLALYVGLLLGAARVLGAAHRVQPVLGLGLAGAFVALFVHSLIYSGFFQNPVTWGSLAVAAAVLAPARVRSARRERAAEPAGRAAPAPAPRVR